MRRDAGSKSVSRVRIKGPDKGQCKNQLSAGEVADDLRGEVMGHLPHVFDGAAGQGAGDDDDARAGHAQRGDPGFGGPGKGAGYDANGRDTLGFGDYGVVETPRCAGASIGNPVNHRVAFLGQRIQGLLGAGFAVGELGRVHHFFGAGIVDQDILQIL